MKTIEPRPPEPFFVVVGRQPWNRRDFDHILARAPGRWVFVATEAELNALLEADRKPRFIFFLHWSLRVPDEILQATECVAFHMTDVPFGRGGSPLQNLISRGFRSTVLSALRMTDAFDAGPVYAKVPLSLEGGTAEEIFQRASRLSCEMAMQIAAAQPEPVAQAGDVTIFKRRRPEESVLPESCETLEGLFDHIRMLDATGYPPAFLDHGPFRLEFNRAALYHEGIQADVKITLRKHPPTSNS